MLAVFASNSGQADLILDVTGYFDLEDPGSTEDPGGTDLQSTLGLPDEPYDGDPAVLDDPSQYPPGQVGVEPWYGYAPAVAPMDCSTYSGGTVTPIGVWGNSPRYLAYSGKIQLLVGASADAACHFLPPTPNTTMLDKCHYGNYETVLNDLKAVAVDGTNNPVLNKIRLWVALGWESNRDNLPFLWDAARGKWQLDQPYDDYFNRLRAVVSKAKELGFFVEVTFFAPFQGPNNGFSASPWSWNANLAEAPPGTRVGFKSYLYFVINDPRTGLEADRNRRMKDFQKNVVKWTIDKLWCYDNVFWEVANEPEHQRVVSLQVAQWQSDMIDWVLKNDCKKSSTTDTTCLTPYGQRTALTRRHLIAVQPFTLIGANTFVGDARVAVLNGHYTEVLTDRVPSIPDGSQDQLNSGALRMARDYSTRAKVLGFNESKITPLGGAGGTRSHVNGTIQQGAVDAARAEAWEFLVDRGGVLDHWGYLPHDAGSTSTVHDIREQLVRLKRFMTGIPLAQLRSSANPPGWITSGTLNAYPTGTLPWDINRKSQRYWAAAQTNENAATGRLFLLYVHNSTRRCSEVGTPPAERDFIATGCPALSDTSTIPGPYLAFGGYDARVWTAPSSLRYRDSFTVDLGPSPGIFDVYWRNPASSPTLDQPPTVIKQQAIAWRQSSCSLANCVVCANPSQCTIGLTSTEGYDFDVLLQIAQRP